MADLECPYCSHELEVCHDDGFGYEEGVKHQMTCSNCDKEFVFETSIVFYYESFKADCLNGSEHNWKAESCSSKQFTKMGCTQCGERRRPTEEEMNKIINQ